MTTVEKLQDLLKQSGFHHATKLGDFTRHTWTRWIKSTPDSGQTVDLRDDGELFEAKFRGPTEQLAALLSPSGISLDEVREAVRWAFDPDNPECPILATIGEVEAVVRAVSARLSKEKEAPSGG